MIMRIKKYIGVMILSLGGIIISAHRGYAADITAVDFYGNVIGQVISTGLVINSEGDNIGSITADSLIINDAGEIIGGVVPQGIVIGNDNRLLGKIHSDGIIRSLSGKTQGKALPNGLAIDSAGNIIGSILYPGLVYSSTGQTIGRVTGVGAYTNLDGQEIGFISANGYAYRKTGDDYVLDGRLMSSKMVVSLEGKFIGSLALSGSVIDFEGKEIGNVHANEYVYANSGTIIGRVIRTSYAFDTAGRYMGIVTYNGDVVNGEQIVGKYRADGNIINDNKNVIGFAVSISATATDNYGRYLGRLLPGGMVIHGQEIIGRAGAGGYVYNKEGEKIGELVETGPVFDTMGRLSGQSMRNGSVISLKGNTIGWMKGRLAYDSNGVLIGGVVDNMLAVDENNNVLGTADINASISIGGSAEIVSPFGYLFNKEGKINGSSFKMKAAYGIEGLLYSYLDPNGSLYRTISDVKLTQKGYLIGKNSFMGDILSPLYALNFSGEKLGNFANNNLIMNSNGAVAYKAIPGNYIVETSGQLGQNMVPIKGFFGNRRIAVKTGGDLLGYADANGKIMNLNGSLLGEILYSDYVADTNKSIIGKLIPFTSVQNEKCVSIGVINGRGNVVNNRDVVIGQLLPNGQALSDTGSYIGYAVFENGLVDMEGNFAGTVNVGNGIDYNGSVLGCVNKHGIIVDGDNNWKYAVITPNPAIDFDNKIIGQVMANGSVVDNKNQILGYMLANNEVVSKSKKSIGNVMKYKVAFTNDNNFLGMIQNTGSVVSSTGEIVGEVNFDGSVVHNGENIGYALYDLYVYDENFITKGYITRDGTVLSFNGSRIGQIKRGFVIDKKRQLIARGNRDYIVRDISNNAVGVLQMDGNVTDFSEQNIGYLGDAGIIRNANGNEVARANQLQYYKVYGSDKDIDDENQDWADYKRVQIQNEDSLAGLGEGSGLAGSSTTGGGKMSRKIVGIALSPDGDIIGNIFEDDRVYDDNGVQIGFKTPDGVIVDMNYNPIGIEEIKHTSASSMFVPAGTFGSGNAYGIGSQPSNLGPGGGYGQGERYDPVRAQALSQLQNVRRSRIHNGSISSGIKVSNFTGYEEDGWPGVSRNISSWRVDMSQMILQDKPIPAVLARSVYASDGLGENIPITAIVERNIYAEEGRNIVIPAGSRVIGSLGGEGSTGGGNSGGAVKIGIQWNRLIRPDGAQFIFGGAQTADAQGRAGAIGYLDEQLLKKYSVPVLSSVLQSVSAYLIAASGETSTAENGSSVTSGKTQAANDVRENFITQMDEIFREILSRKANIQAVTYIPAGTRIIIFPNEDLWLNTETRDKDRVLKDVERGSGLTLDNPGEVNGNNVSYNGNTNANVRPTGGRRVSNNTGRVRPASQRPAVPPSTIQQGNTTSDDDVPALM